MNLELKSERVRRGFKQEDLAKKIGLSLVTYARKEKGTRKFTIDEVKKIAIVLNLDLVRLNEIFFNNELTIRYNK